MGDSSNPGDMSRRVLILFPVVTDSVHDFASSHSRLVGFEFRDWQKRNQTFTCCLASKFEKNPIMGCFSLSSNLIGKHFFVTATEKNEGTK